MARDMDVPVLARAKPRSPAAWASLLALPAILILTAVVYSPALDDWFIYHDFIHLGAAATHSAGDYATRVLDPGDGGESLFNTGRLYRPTYYLTMLLEYKAFGLADAFPYHMVNFSLHLLNIVLVWLIARKLTGSQLATNTAALVYGLHPIFFEAPIWISAITEVLLATFFFGSLYLFMRSLETRGLLSGLLYGGSFVAALLALGAREPGVSLFVVLPAYYFLVHAPEEWRQPRAWLRFVPFFVVLGGYAIMRYSITRDVATGEGGNAVGEVGWHMFTNVFLFNGWMLVPIFSSLGRWLPVVMGFAAILLMRVHERFFFHGGRVGIFLVVWWYAVVFVYSTAGWVRALMAGRYLYMASGAFAILAGLTVLWGLGLVRRWQPNLLPLARVAVPVALVALVAPALTWGTLHHMGNFSDGSRDSQLFIEQLRDTYPSLPEGSTLYVVDPPFTLLFAGGPFFLTPAVQWYYPGVEAKNITAEEAADIASVMDDQDHIIFYDRQSGG